MIGSWVDCKNPFYRINHGYFRRIDFPSNQGFCPDCWNRMLRMERHPQPITTYRQKPKAFKQCGSDTL